MLETSWSFAVLRQTITWCRQLGQTRATRRHGRWSLRVMFPATGSLCNQITSTTTFFALRARTFTNAVHTAILGCAGLLSLGLVAAATWFTNGEMLGEASASATASAQVSRRPRRRLWLLRRRQRCHLRRQRYRPARCLRLRRARCRPCRRLLPRRTRRHMRLRTRRRNIPRRHPRKIQLRRLCLLRHQAVEAMDDVARTTTISTRGFSCTTRRRFAWRRAALSVSVQQ